MITMTSKDLLDQPILDFIIPSEKVAHVQVGNSAEHALLVLTKTGYSAVPVLDYHSKLVGLISSQMITESILGLEHIEFHKLDQIKVEEVMTTEVAILKLSDTFRKAFDLVINHAFICVVNEKDEFVGIFTRRIMLKQLKKYVYLQE